MAARICPQCRTRVDERRAKTSPYCLSCGAPLGSGLNVAAYGSGAFQGKPVVAKSPLPWILGGIGLFVVLGFGGCAAFLFATSSSKAETKGPTGAENLNGGPIVETPTAQPTVSAVPSAKVAGTVKVPVKVTAPPPTAPPVLGAFPRAQANNEVSRVTSSLSSCKRSGDPSGSGSIRVDFEPDGRVGTVLAKPFAGTLTGSCIASRYGAIRIGAFQGTTQSISRTFTISGGLSDPGF